MQLVAATHPGDRAMPRATSAPVPGPELPPVPPKHPALPNPVPGLAQLAAIADAAPADQRFTAGAHPSTIRNAHYTDTRAQLAYALAGPYNSVEGDVRMRDGIPVMSHDPKAQIDLTFEQWATLAARAGKHLRIDLKESRAIPAVTAILERIGAESGRVTFNVGVLNPFASATTTLETIRGLRTRFPDAWVTINLPVPLGPGYLLAARVARELGPRHLGVAITAGLTFEHDVRLLRRSFEVVNAWNVPQLFSPDVPAMVAKLRAMGVNGMIDLRRREDPLAND